MKISSIGTLFASNIDAVSNPLQRDNESTSKGQEEQVTSNDAVVYSKAFTTARQSESAIDGARLARIQKLKEQVQGGDYQPDLDKVARAVLQELS